MAETSSDNSFQVFCDTAKALDFTTLYQFQNSVKMVFSAAAVPIIVFMILKRKHLIYGEHHFIIHFKIAIILLFAINNTLMHGFLVTDRLFNSNNPCQWVRTASDCVIYKAVQNCAVATISTTLFFITLEKAIFVVADLSIANQHFLPRVFSINQCCWTFIIFISTILIDYDNPALVLHCAEPTARTSNLVNIISYQSIICSGFTLITSLWMRWYISRQLRSETNLSRSFILRQSMVTNNAFLPNILFHTVTLIILNTTLLVIRPIVIGLDKTKMKAIQGIVNMTPYYAFFCPLLLMFGMHRLKEGPRSYHRDRIEENDKDTFRVRKKEFTDVFRPRMDGRVVPESIIYEATLQKMWR